VCYFLAIGAVADPLQFGAFFEEQLEVDVAAAQARLVAAFPTEDVVRVLTHRGCSCDLLELGSLAGSAVPGGALCLTLACRRVLAIAAAQLGSLRIYLKSRRDWRPGRVPRLTMTIDELLARRVGLPSDVLIEVVVGILPSELN
jgi:hypothetical protein